MHGELRGWGLLRALRLIAHSIRFGLDPLTKPCGLGRLRILVLVVKQLRELYPNPEWMMFSEDLKLHCFLASPAWNLDSQALKGPSLALL